MTAAVYAEEIVAQYDCATCYLASTWDERGRCTSEVPGGLLTLQATVRDHKHQIDMPSHVSFPGPDTSDNVSGWATCPRGWRRRDLRPDSVALASLVGQAVSAEAHRLWPDVPSRLYSLMLAWKAAESEKREAQQRAQQERHG